MRERADEAIEVRFDYDRGLSRRAMTGWWQSAVPPEPFVKRVVVWAVFWIGLLVLTLGIAAAGLTPMFTVAGLVGAGAVVAVFAYLQRTRMRRFWDEIGRHWERAGPTGARFDAQGLTVTDAVSERRFRWAAIDAVRPVRGGTVFRSGISMLVVPDAALPGGTSPAAFRERLQGWRAGA